MATVAASQPVSAPASVAGFDLEAINDVVGRLSDSGMVARGSVTVLELDAVKERLLERWPAKREQVWEQAERTLERELGVATVISRVSETAFVVGQPGREGPQAQALALHALKEVLSFFLGQFRPSDIALRRVDGFKNGEMVCSALDPLAVTAAASAQPRAPDAAEKPRPGDAYKVFPAVDGTVLRVSCSYDGLVSLRANQILAGHRLIPCLADVSGPNRLSVRLASLDWGDAERVDRTVLKLGADLLESLPARPPLCLVPASFSSVSSQKARRDFLEEVAEVGGRLRCRVAIELRDLRGVPAGRLAEVVALLKPACFGVVADVAADKLEIAALVGGGFNGVSIRTLADWSRDPQLVAHFRSLAEIARRIAPICISRVPNRERFPILIESHFTHALVPS